MMTRILYILILLFSVACQYKAQDSGELIAGHQQVENAFSVSVPSSGTRKVGDVLTFTLTHPYSVTVTGTPRLTLTIGASTAYANYASGTGTTTLTFTYTVGSGDTDTDGIDVATTIDLNSGTLQFTGTSGLADCSTSITVPSTSGIKADTTAPAVSSVSAPTNGTYYVNMPMVFSVTMNEATVITGTPRLTLTIGSTTRYANYLSGSGTTSLIFSYTPVAADSDTNGIAMTASIDANGGTLQDAATNDATLTFSAPNTASVLVDGNKPYVTAVTPPANGTYTVGDALDFVFTYSELVNVTGTPTFTLTVGSTARTVSYYSGSGSTQLTFRYVIQSGETDTNGVTSGSTFSMTSATIRDATSTNALNAFTMPSLASILVADNRPVISSFLVNNATYYIGQSFTITALFNQAVTVTGTPRIPITLNTGGPIYATYTSGSGTTNIVFTATVTAGTDDSNGVVITTPVDLNSGTIKNSSNLDANLTFTQPSTPSLKVSGIAPTITSITPPANGTYTTGQNLDFIVNFSETVTAGNTANVKLNLDIGGTTRQASYLSGTGTSAITFRYAVVGADADTNGISITALSITSTGYIKDGSSTANSADTTFTPPDTSAVLVNATTPSVSSVTSPANGTYIIGQNLDFILNYSEAVTVTGSPRLPITIGSSTAYATYSSGSGTTSVTFRYTITSGDLDTDGIAASTTLDNNGGSVSSALSVAASTTVPAQTLTSVIIDGSAPSIVSTSKPSNGTYTTSSPSFSFTVTYDQAVTVTGTPRLTITAGSSTIYADYASGTGTTALVFTHTVASTDFDLDGISVATSIDLNGGTLEDANGNTAATTIGSLDTSSVLINYTGMMAWWDVDDATKVSTIGCTSGTCVNQITDKSGSGIHATATGAAKPIYSASGFSGGNSAYIQFDEISMIMGASSAINPVRTVFIVFQTEVATMTTQDLFYQSGLTVKVEVVNNGNLALAVPGAYSLNGSALAGSASTFAAGFAANTPYILGVQYNSGYNFTTPQLGSTNFGGKIAEVLIYSTALTAAQAASVVQYLNAKHQVY